MADNKKVPAMLLYVSDFLGHEAVQEMNYEEVNLYLRLLMCCHQSDDDTIPDDPERLARKVRCNDFQEFMTNWPLVRACFTEVKEKPGYITHPRVTRGKDEARKRSQDGVDAANKRWNPESSSSTKTKNFVAAKRAKDAAEAEASIPRGPAGVQDRIDALLTGAGPALRPFRGDLTAEQYKLLEAATPKDCQVLGEYIHAGLHWTAKTTEQVGTVAAVLRASFENTLGSALAWDRGGRKGASSKNGVIPCHDEPRAKTEIVDI